MKPSVTRSWGWLPLLALAGLLAWGSWQAPNLHEYATPNAFALLDAPGLTAGPAAERLQAQAMALPGVSACAVRPAKQLLTIAYDPGRLSEAELCERLGGLHPLLVPPPDPTARQCPVPPGYVLALEKLRFAFNLQRLFIRV